jgi:(4-(4-[2-(gamma-L-glutamylamino)ethyl]phenoxymethyl)furan-2-yl)methanamine synthase
MTISAGLDVGGAHLKVALAESGRTVAVQQFVCPLWQGLDKLDAALLAAQPLLSRAHRFGVTMTGELSDLFTNRKNGVETLVARVDREFGARARFWMGPHGFGSADEARHHCADVGSTNFLATATFVATHLSDALLIDFGSTTADVLPITAGKAAPHGLTDAERQTTGELVYTGLTRTAVMGVTTRAPFKGRMQGLAREYLATMADVRRIIGSLPEDVDQHATADGRGTSVEESIARFARMSGRDAHEGSLDDWRASADFVRMAQLTSIEEGIGEVLAVTPIPPAAPIIAAGIGATEVTAIATRLGRSCVAFSDLANTDTAFSFWATACAPAVSVAHLLSR